ncbi:MAG: CPBP family intramembrane glutamic endopeptidase [bacterium JZ-2024 1]
MAIGTIVLTKRIELQYTLVPEHPESPECIERFARETARWQKEYDATNFEADFSTPLQITFKMRKPLRTMGEIGTASPRPVPDPASGCGIYKFSAEASIGPHVYWSMFLFMAPAFLLVALYRIRKRKGLVLWERQHWHTAAWLSALVAVLVTGILSVSSLLLLFWFPEPPDTTLWAQFVQYIRESPMAFRIVLIAMIVLLAPVSEEVFFRGYWFGELRLRYGWKVAGWVISLMFALGHIAWMVGAHPAWLVYELFNVFVASWVAIGLYLRFQTLLGPIIFHGVYNALAILVGLYQ